MKMKWSYFDDARFYRQVPNGTQDIKVLIQGQSLSLSESERRAALEILQHLPLSPFDITVNITYED